MNKFFILLLLAACITCAPLSPINVSLKPQIVVELEKNRATTFIANTWATLKKAYHNATKAPKNHAQEEVAPAAPEDRVALFIKNHPKAIYFVLGILVGAYAYNIAHSSGQPLHIA